MSVDGTYEPAFAPVADLLAANLDDGTDVGAAVAVVHDGALVVDVWGGEARPGVAWERDTLVQVWSVSKTLCALAVLVLADRAEVDLDVPVSTYWPAFTAPATVRQVLGHTSGVPGWSRTVSLDDYVDLARSEAWLAEEAPWYEPGSATAYQILDHGHLLDAVVRGAVDRPLADVVRDEVVAPSGAAGQVHLGVPDDALDRCADLIAPTGRSIDLAALPPESFLRRTMLNPLVTAPGSNTAAWRRAAVGAVNAHATARGLALTNHALVTGGAPLMSSVTAAEVLEVPSAVRPDAGPDAVDLVLGVPVTFGTGWALASACAPAVSLRSDGGERQVAWWTGYGGAIVVNDLESRTTVAYAPNRLEQHLVASPRTDAYVRTALACLEDL